MLEMKFGTTIKMFFVVLTFSTGLGDSQLRANFKYYEIAHQNHFRHTIKRRSIGNEYQSTNLDVTFKNKNYRFELKRDDSLFRSDFKVYGVNEQDVATEIQGFGLNLFHGHVAGESERSKVSAIFEDDGKLGSFVVRTVEDTFAGEPLISFDREARNVDKLIIYSIQDMKSSGRHERKYRSCGNNETREEEHHIGRAPTIKRSTNACQDENRKACSLYIAVDHSFFENVGGRSISTTGKIVVSVMDFVNAIFKETTFGECGRNFGFQIRKMYIYQNVSNNISHFNHDKKGSWNSKEFLCSFGDEQFGRELPNHCLGHLFTARPMLGDVLGLSNIASKIMGQQSGLCSKKLRTSCNQLKFVNTGFTSFVDSFSKRLPSLQAALVAAHELGHSFGSHHDNDPSCAQDKYPGFYLMYTYSVSGAEPNNKVFSKCSISEIKEVLKSKTASCLEAYNTSLCGNYKIEVGEECDDGFEGSKCCSDQCRLKGDSQCGLNQECCSECKFSENEVACRSSAPCLGSASCSGYSAICPESVPANINSTCQTRSNLPGRCARSGKCLNLCELKGQLTCFCHGENMCKVCCKDKYPENSTCELYDDEAQDLPDGLACAFGVCHNGQCKKTEVGQVQRLWTIIDIKNISSIVIFTKNNVVGLVLIVSLMVWIPASCFVVHLDRKIIEEELETLQWMSSSQTSFLPEKSKIKIRHSVASH